MINNKPNSAAVEFNFSTAGNMAKSKAYTNEKLQYGQIHIMVRT